MNADFKPTNADGQPKYVIDWETYGVEDAVTKLIEYAAEIRASDVFFLSHEHYTRVAIRHLGSVREVTKFSPEFGRRAITTVKALADMDISDRLRPGEGRRIHHRRNRPSIDLRVNSIPTVFGEDVTIRILDREIGLLQLADLRMPQNELNSLHALLQKPAGLILVTGPTGSGKTTTLYACIQHLNDGHRKINTLEDPVEFIVPGVNQSQVNSKLDVDFPDLLASCLRQAPDVIMIGEIRDPVTATTAVRAANSGHLVLATLHAPVAVAASQSMAAYGVNRTFLANSLLGVVSQRLVRGLCPACRLSIDVSDVPGIFDQVKAWLEPGVSPTIYAPAGCEKCLHSGYDRRICLAEVLVVDDDLREMIIHGKSTPELHRRALEKGMIDFAQAATLQIARGDTTMEEMFRAIPTDYLQGSGDFLRQMQP
ncbi:MAG: type II/IV secretion system protein [Planctomycetales bacterium]|nr:type II/IV secretion system protein [Planctomycetales bacterium]